MPTTINANPRKETKLNESLNLKYPTQAVKIKSIPVVTGTTYVNRPDESALNITRAEKK